MALTVVCLPYLAGYAGLLLGAPLGLGALWLVQRTGAAMHSERSTAAERLVTAHFTTFQRCLNASGTSIEVMGPLLSRRIASMRSAISLTSSLSPALYLLLGATVGVFLDAFYSRMIVEGTGVDQAAYLVVQLMTVLAGGAIVLSSTLSRRNARLEYLERLEHIVDQKNVAYSGLRSCAQGNSKNSQ